MYKEFKKVITFYNIQDTFYWAVSRNHGKTPLMYLPKICIQYCIFLLFNEKELLNQLNKQKIILVHIEVNYRLSYKNTISSEVTELWLTDMT